MKSRKKTKQQMNEDRNALYHKVILRNQELGRKNTELAGINQQLIMTVQHLKAVLYLREEESKKKWWQFWKWFKT